MNINIDTLYQDFYISGLLGRPDEYDQIVVMRCSFSRFYRVITSAARDWCSCPRAVTRSIWRSQSCSTGPFSIFCLRLRPASGAAVRRVPAWDFWRRKGLIEIRGMRVPLAPASQVSPA